MHYGYKGYTSNTVFNSKINLCYIQFTLMQIIGWSKIHTFKKKLDAVFKYNFTTHKVCKSDEFLITKKQQCGFALFWLI